MIIDGKKIEIGSVFIADSVYTVQGKKVNTNQITIVSKNKKYEFIFWTLVHYNDFNSLKLNEKVDITEKVDYYDIDLIVDGTIYLNNIENTHIYFTKLDENIFQLNVEIIHPGEQSILKGKKNVNISKFEVETIIDFTKVV